MARRRESSTDIYVLLDTKFNTYQYLSPSKSLYIQLFPVHAYNYKILMILVSYLTVRIRRGAVCKLCPTVQF